MVIKLGKKENIFEWADPVIRDAYLKVVHEALAIYNKEVDEAWNTFLEKKAKATETQINTELEAEKAYKKKLGIHQRSATI